jgi:CheY-like chemotaxis protein
MSNDTGGGNILIVDDTLDNLRLLSQLLTEHGHSVRAAKSGWEALASIQAAKPDLILLDIKLPDLSGYEVCARLKADAATCVVPIMFLSALDETEDKLRAFKVAVLRSRRHCTREHPS